MVTIVPRKQTIPAAPFTFVIEDSGLHGDEGILYIVDCLIDGYHVGGSTFICKQTEYEAHLQVALADAKKNVRGKLEAMRTEIARMQAIVDKLEQSSIGEKYADKT